MASFRVQLATLAEGHSQLHLEGSPVELDLPAEHWPEPVRLDAELDRRGDQLTLRGELSTETLEECARCLCSFRSRLESEFTVIADRGGRHSQEDEPEMDDYLLYHDGRVLELETPVREQIVLSRPMLSLCRPDCKGLCLRCGADLNAEPCTCESGRVGSPPGTGSTA